MRVVSLENEPELYPHLYDVWEAFHRLSSSRQVSMGGAGAIPFEVIDRYAERFGVEDFETFYHLIAALDGAYLEHVNAKTKTPAKGK